MKTTEHTQAASMHCLPGMLALLALAACGTYKPGSLGKDNPTTMRTVGCLDVAVEAISDAKAEGPAARLRFGNRCNAAVLVDFVAIAATVRYRDGHVGTARVHDPESTLRPVLLDVGKQGWEAFEYHAVDAEDDSRVPQALCLDLAAMDRHEPGAEPVVVCVEAHSDYLLRARSSEEDA